MANPLLLISTYHENTPVRLRFYLNRGATGIAAVPRSLDSFPRRWHERSDSALTTDALDPIALLQSSRWKQSRLSDREGGRWFARRCLVGALSTAPREGDQHEKNGQRELHFHLRRAMRFECS